MDKKIDLAYIHSHLISYLFNSQKDYEYAINEYANFRDAWVNKKIEYERSFSEKVEELKTKDEPVTITKELAKRECFTQYKEMLEAETQYKKCKLLTEGLKERIQTIKFIGKIKFNMLNE